MLRILIVLYFLSWGTFEAAVWHQEEVASVKTQGQTKSKVIFPRVTLGENYQSEVAVINTSQAVGSCSLSEYSPELSRVVRVSHTPVIGPGKQFSLRLVPVKSLQKAYIVIIANCNFASTGVLTTTNLQKKLATVELAY
ncbi:MAG: hypothetical protein JNN11_03785 [Candidatus Doudnabacteria bacterium]|nr:hypothetical protein [Candidatus Doudnabacteria bacterium]